MKKFSLALALALLVFPTFVSAQGLGNGSGLTIVPGSGGSGTPGNPTATAGATAINGSASTYMRSDAAPAISLGSASTFGIVKADGTTITASGGVLTSVGGGGGVTVVCPTTGSLQTTIAVYAAPVTRSGSTDTPASTDCGKNILYSFAGSVTDTFLSASVAGSQWGATYCAGSGTTVNMTSGGGNFQANGTTVYAISPGTCITPISDGANWYTVAGGGSSSGGSGSSVQAPSCSGASCGSPAFFMFGTGAYANSNTLGSNLNGYENCEVGQLGAATHVSGVSWQTLTSYNASPPNYQIIMRTPQAANGMPGTAVAWTPYNTPLPTGAAGVYSVSFSGGSGTAALTAGVYYTCINMSAAPSTGAFVEASPFGNGSAQLSFMQGVVPATTTANLWYFGAGYGISCSSMTYSTSNSTPASPVASNCSQQNTQYRIPHFGYTAASQP
jgi:hypothetical protein